MGYTISYTLARATALTPAEIERLARHVGQWSARVKGYELRVASGRTGVVAFGWVKTGYDGGRIVDATAAPCRC